MYLDKLLLDPLQDGINYSWILSSLTFACMVMLAVFGWLLPVRFPPHREYFWWGIGSF